MCCGYGMQCADDVAERSAMRGTDQEGQLRTNARLDTVIGRAWGRMLIAIRSRFGSIEQLSDADTDTRSIDQASRARNADIIDEGAVP